ncbi:hypothetical protein IH980_00190 [Patescibacteria group bacterium]|nr:hypothetical protein [Patescibacteria group bacterium]
MVQFRAEVLEVDGKEPKKKRRGLFHRRRATTSTSQKAETSATKKAAEPAQITESPWVQSARAQTLPTAEYDSSEIATGRKIIQTEKKKQKREKKVQAAKARLGLEHSKA